MTHFEIQTLRYIHLMGSSPISARTMGLRKSELSALVAERYVQFGMDGYSGTECKVSERGMAFLKSLGAACFGNPKWDDEVFAKLLDRTSRHPAERLERMNES